MRRICINVDSKCCNSSTKSCCSNSKIIYLFKNLFFHCFNRRKLGMSTHRSCKCLLCHKSSLFKCTANTNTDNNWRTGIWSCFPYSGYNRIHCTFHTICRFKHKYTAHIFTSEALWCYSKLNILSWNNAVMNNSRSIIFCIFSDKWVIYYRFAKISFYISIMYPFIDGIRKRTALNMYILAYLCKYNCHPCILTDWNLLYSCNIKILF